MIGRRCYKESEEGRVGGPEAPPADGRGPASDICNSYIRQPGPAAQQNSSSPCASPTSSECLSGSLSTRLLSECLSERSELMEARL